MNRIALLVLMAAVAGCNEQSPKSTEVESVVNERIELFNQTGELDHDESTVPADVSTASDPDLDKTWNYLVNVKDFFNRQSGE